MFSLQTLLVIALLSVVLSSASESEPHWYKRNQNTIQAIYNLTIFPANAKIIAEGSSAVPAGLFNINATGRVTPDSIEYFFGLTPLPSGVPPNGAITNATLVEFTSGCPKVATSTVYLTVSTINPDNSTGAYITALKQFRIIPFARLVALHLFYGTDILLAFRLRGGCAQIRWIPFLDLFPTALTDGTFYTPAGMNGIIEGICGLSVSDCVQTLDAKPFGQFDETWGDNVVHCPHVSPSGGGKCINVTYNDVYFNDWQFLFDKPLGAPFHCSDKLLQASSRHETRILDRRVKSILTVTRPSIAEGLDSSVFVGCDSAVSGFDKNQEKS
ncbi:hypothetical protein B0H11DRAFT_2206332 [Mycena galericulata]|nr:hypothetical protein B0H11DRAFT_2206332 [Mycena galericulata]